MKLSKIYVSQSQGDSIKGISFELTDTRQRLQSPLFMGRVATNEWRVLADNLDRLRITKVGLKVWNVGKIQAY